MYDNGSIVTLSVDKEHFDGMDTLKLKTGTCGMVVRQVRRASDGNHPYVVDFGAYGQWNCTHNELNGDDPEGWDDTPTLRVRMNDPRTTSPTVDSVARALGIRVPEGVTALFDGDLVDVFRDTAPINVEEDIRRRMQEIEAGK
jgi:hypothetical protein